VENETNPGNVELTLDQVKEAGVFAWNDDRYLYLDGRLLRMLPHSDGTVEVSESDERARNAFAQRGWHHLARCHCRFCRQPATPRTEIVHVDDDEACRYVLSRTLRAAGYAVVEATCAEQALQLITTSTDLVLLDINLPDLDGLEVCRRLKSDPGRCHIPVVFVTATAGDAEWEKAGIEAGADVFVRQPIDAQQLLALVEDMARK